jgi:hypothetical protein
VNFKKYIQASYKLDSDSVIEREFGVFENIKDSFEKMVSYRHHDLCKFLWCGIMFGDGIIG